MTTVAIFNAIAGEVAAIFNDLTAGVEVYLSPSLIALPAMKNFEIQIVDSGSEVLDRDGSISRVQFSVLIGLFVRIHQGYDQRHARALSGVSEGILVKKEAIRSALDGSFLVVDAAEILTRPLAYMRESPTREVPSVESLLVKELMFTGGVNNDV